jgi:hypothetical protein
LIRVCRGTAGHWIWNPEAESCRIGRMAHLMGVLRRLTGLSLALAFTATATAAMGAHAGPHHEGIAAVSGEPAGSHSAHAAHETPDAPGHDGPCTCVGACATQVPVALPSVPVVRAPASASATIPVRAEDSTAAVLAAPPYLLPFATAPPVR